MTPGSPPPLVLLPGTLCDERVFAPMLAAWRRHATPGPADVAVLLTDTCGSMREAALRVLSAAPPRFAVAGFSLGGLVALETALLAPERVVGLALLNVNAAAVPVSAHAARRQAVLQAGQLGVGEYLRQQLWPKYVGPASCNDATMQNMLATMAADIGPASFHSQTEAALTRENYLPLLSRLGMPSVVLSGEHDALCAVETQQEMARLLPNAEFVVVADAGHFALLERPDTVAVSVAAWFHRILSGVQQLNQEKT